MDTIFCIRTTTIITNFDMVAGDINYNIVFAYQNLMYNDKPIFPSKPSQLISKDVPLIYIWLKNKTKRKM